MESALESASAVGDQRRKIERYKEILFGVISSSDIIEAKKFIDHVLSDEVALVVSRQLLNLLAQELWKLKPEFQEEILDYTLNQIKLRVVSFEIQKLTIKETLAVLHESEKQLSKAAQEPRMSVIEESSNLPKCVQVARLNLKVQDHKEHLPPPLLLTIFCNEEVKMEMQSFYNLQDNSSQNRLYPELESVLVLDCDFGWMVLINTVEDKCHLFNPTTQDVIHVNAVIKNIYSYNRCTFSTAPSETDCCLIFSQYSGKMMFLYRIVEQAGICIDLEEQILENVIALTRFRGVMYGIGTGVFNKYEFGTYKVVGDTFDNDGLSDSDGYPWRAPEPLVDDVSVAIRYYMMECACGDELVLVIKTYQSVDHPVFKVYCVDIDGKQVQEIHNLNGKSVFIDESGSGVCRYVGDNIRSNSIFYTDRLGSDCFNGRAYYVYSMEDGNTIEVIPTLDYSVDPVHSYTRWVDFRPAQISEMRSDNQPLPPPLLLTVPPPLLLTVFRNNEQVLETQSFYNPVDDTYQIRSYFEMNSMLVLDSAYGWLVLIDTVENQCSLFNPTTREVINVIAEFNNISSFKGCIFSKAPTEVGCFLVFTQYSGKDRFVYRIDEEVGFYDNLAEPNPYAEHLIERIVGLTSFQGAVYAICSIESQNKFHFLTYEVDENAVEVNPLEVGGDLWEAPQPLGTIRNYMVQTPCGKELLLITKIFCQGGIEFRVFQVDIERRKVEELDNIDGKAIFINDVGNGVCRYSGGAIRSNSIYYLEPFKRSRYNGNTWSIFGLDDSSTITVILPPYDNIDGPPYDNIDERKMSTYWVDFRPFQISLV